MLKALPPQDVNDTEKYPVIMTFDNGSLWLKRRGKPTKKITAWWWAGIAAMLLILFNPF
ncbi:hypothetical protein KZ843_12530 [Pseudomonas aeruginosa]|nr:hypothetical protein [Pseudomonas aeruginosa]MBW6123704.1 hypothetical protein [Pseudomonas aeruginosa]